MRIAVLGVGLIGGSIGRAARERLGAEVAGFDPDPGGRRRALELGAVDVACETVAEAAEGAELVFCAAPVARLPDLVEEALAASGPDAAVTDVGSTKRGLIAAVASLEGADRFIGGHPLAGAETAGVEGARADLFDGARWYLTPTERSQGVLYDRLQGALAGIGARPQAIDGDVHDREMAAISHLPHVLSNVLVEVASAALPAPEERPAEAGRSFRDATRVAGANPPIWADIFGTNTEELVAGIEATVERLRSTARLLEAGDRDALAAWQAEVRELRRGLLEQDLEAGPLVELRIAVSNRPGTVAEIALALGRGGVNIEDMSLFPAADRQTGAISLWIAGEEAAARAAEIIAGLGHAVAPVPGAEA